MTDIITNFFLSLSHDTIIIPFVTLGYIWLDRKLFFNAISLLLLSIIFNSALKITFQIPLSPLLNKEGFTFPSGHMQSSTVLYGWIFLHTQNLFYKLLIIIALFGIAISLVHYGYHDYYDILGAIFFSSLLLAISYKTIKKQETFFPKIVFIISTVMIIYISINYQKILEHL
ncbi:MAG: phosphatase PAP2 family protein [Rickettsiaceae bacterium]